VTLQLRCKHPRMQSLRVRTSRQDHSDIAARCAEYSRDFGCGEEQSTPTAEIRLAQPKEHENVDIEVCSCHISRVGHDRCAADAADPHINDWANITSTVTREQVKQEMREAYARGDRDYGERAMSSRRPKRHRAAAPKFWPNCARQSVWGSSLSGEGSIPVATAEQERLIAKAGHDAAEQLRRSAQTSRDNRVRRPTPARAPRSNPEANAGIARGPSPRREPPQEPALWSEDPLAMLQRLRARCH